MHLQVVFAENSCDSTGLTKARFDWRKTLAEVRGAAGHANVSITSGYLHVAVDDAAGIGNLFQWL